MIRTRLAALAFVAACFAAPAFAQLPPLVQTALAKVEVEHDNWAFTQTSTDSDGKTVETFDPSRPDAQQWQLVLKDGHKPTASELADYAKKKQNRKNKGQGRKNEFSAMVRPGSLRLVRETPDQAVFEFRLPLEDEAKGDADARAMIDLMKGRFTIAKNGEWLQLFEIENEKAMKPVTGVSIERMYTRMAFRAPASNVPPLLGELKITVRGRAFLVKKIDQDSVVTFTDYRRVR